MIPQTLHFYGSFCFLSSEFYCGKKVAKWDLSLSDGSNLVSNKQKSWAPETHSSSGTDAEGTNGVDSAKQWMRVRNGNEAGEAISSVDVRRNKEEIEIRFLEDIKPTKEGQ